MPTFSVTTHRRCEMIDITERIRQAVADSGVQQGVVTVFALHTTAAITINENADRDVVRDLLVNLKRLAPHTGDYRHAEGNSDAHLKSSLLGVSETVLIDDGRLQLGTWQSVFFCEFDGPRTRKVALQVVPA